MTLEERVAQLEMTVAKYEAFFRFGVSDDGLVAYVSTQGRLGVMTNYWCRKSVGQGAGLSVGTAVDRFGIYAEIDGGPDGMAACPDHPSTAIYGAVVVPHRPGEHQPNLAFEAHAQNAPSGNTAYYGDVQYAPDAPVKVEPIVIGEMVDGTITRRKVIGFD